MKVVVAIDSLKEACHPWKPDMLRKKEFSPFIRMQK